jgi:enoyl-CoA hydratase/carnithine racemase
MSADGDDDARVDVRTAADAVCVVTLRRERKLNALSSALEGALQEALVRPEVRDARCVVITGGERVFSAGADVGELRDRDPAAILGYYRATGDVYERVACLPQPTIAAIAGYCLGGGMELALACDFRVADQGAVFGLPEVAIGILPSSGATHRLVRLVGGARAKELVLLRERLTASEAAALGVLTEVVGDGAALERAVELAMRLAALPALAVQVAKQALGAMPESSREAGLLVERLGYGMLAQTSDAREAAAALTEKREPRFQGR